MSPPTLYEALIQPLRVLDEQEGGLLQRLLERPQFHVDATRERILSLAATDDPATCPAALLPYLKDHVGFGSELGAVFANLDAPTLRKLIRLAVPFWMEKGTAHGLVAAARALSGRDPIYEDWFDLRTRVGVSVLGESGALGSSPMLGEAGEYHSSLRVVDDGVLSEALLLELVALLRPAGERIQVTLLDFADQFNSGLDRWTQWIGPVPPYIEDGAMILPRFVQMIPAIGSVPPEQLTNVEFSWRFRIDEATDTFVVRWYFTGANYFRLYLSPTSPQVVLQCWDGSIHTLYSGGLVGGATLVPGQFYRCRVEVQNGTYPFVRFYFEDILQYSSPAGGEPYPLVTSGRFLFGARNTNAGLVAADDVEIWRSPKRWAEVGPAGVTVSPTFYG